VYLDAVLHPRAKHDSSVLQQEGWHYELEDPKEPLTYKVRARVRVRVRIRVRDPIPNPNPIPNPDQGVVYNEMKGVYSSPDSLLYRTAQQALTLALTLTLTLTLSSSTAPPSRRP